MTTPPRRRQPPPARRRRTPAQNAEHNRTYGQRHRELRRQLQKQVDAGAAICHRCNRLITPGSAWHLGHSDHPMAKMLGIYLGPEHAVCSWESGGLKRMGKVKAPPPPPQRAKALDFFNTSKSVGAEQDTTTPAPDD